MPRRFEFKDPTSAKFWEIEQSGNSFTTWWGKIGSNAPDSQTKTKTFASETEATAEYEKIIGEKTRKGYIEVGSGGTSSAPSVSAKASPAPSTVAAASVTPSAPSAVAKPASGEILGGNVATLAERQVSGDAGKDSNNVAVVEKPVDVTQEFKKIYNDLCSQIKEKVDNFEQPRFLIEIKIAEFSCLKPLFAMPPEHQAASLFLVMKELKRPLSLTRTGEVTDALEQIANRLCRRSLPFSDSQLTELIGAAASDFPSKAFPGSAVIDLVESFQESNSASEQLAAALKKFKAEIQKHGANWGGTPDAQSKKLMQRIDVLRQRIAGGGNEAAIPMAPQEAWSDQAIADLKAMDATALQAWLHLLDHCSRTSGTAPSATWAKKANELVSAISEESFITHVHRWFSIFPQKGSRTDHEYGAIGEIDGAQAIRPQNAEILKGLAFCCVGRTDSRLASALGDAAESSFKKIPNLGPRCVKLGTACVHSLASMNTKESIAQLTRVQAKAKHASVKEQIEKALNNAATKSGMSVDDLQDIGVPDFGMQEVGKLVRDFGNWSAHLSVEEADTITTSWVSDKGKTQQSVPAEIKTAAPDRVKELKKIEQDLEKLLPGLRTRLERSYIDQRQWRFSEWRERFLNHPVTGTLARRLLWNFNGRTGFWHEGKFIDQEGTSFTPEGDSVVELWHPIGVDPQVVLNWRSRLTDLRVVQPFKQCHREIYVLTDAELNTRSYSNRFSAHILRQHQFQHLCAQRGWKYTLMGPFDSYNTPTLDLPRWNLSVEFFVDAVPEENVGIYANISSDKVQFLRCLTDAQVRDRRTTLRYESIPLSEISPVLFSEVMRDVDLFVSVCSIGTDPNWVEGRHSDYWRTYAFGELGSSAHTRKQVLEELIPHLRIASRCRFEGRFLIVKGDMRTYKIHLGSGNILMEPNDEYLCIVAARGLTSSSEKVFLPFEGDSMLSLILSKAFMLAEDLKIKDRSILSQINHSD